MTATPDAAPPERHRTYGGTPPGPRTPVDPAEPVESAEPVLAAAPAAPTTATAPATAPDTGPGPGTALVLSVGDFLHASVVDPHAEAPPLTDTTGYARLGFARSRAEAVGASLTGLGYRLHGDGVLADPTRTVARATLDDVIADKRPDGGLVLHVISHGWTDSTGALRIALADSEPNQGLDIESLLRDLENSKQSAALVLLDVCHAGAAVRWQWQNWQTWSAGLRAGARGAAARRAWVLAAAAPDEKAYDGRFSQAVALVLDRLSVNGLDTDASLEYVPLSLVTREIRTTLHTLWQEAQSYAQHLDSTPIALGDEPSLRLFRNPRYAPTPLARLRQSAEESLRSILAELDPVLDAHHYITRAFGGTSSATATTTCLFSGRTAELDILTPWVDGAGTDSLAVVTGGPGTGKSALLGLLVCAAQPQLREALFQRLPPVALPGRDDTFAAVHARGRDAGQLATSIGKQLRLSSLPPRGLTPAELVRRLTGTAERRRGPVPTVVVDALDEALDPGELVEVLLLPLALTRVDQHSRSGPRPVCRLLVGTRTTDTMSRIVAEARTVGLLVDLDDADPGVLRTDVAGFVRRHLDLSPLYDAKGQAVVRERLATELAAALVPDDPPEDGAAPGPYLLARLYLHQLLAATAPVAPDQITAVVARAPRTVMDMLELELVRLKDPFARPLLKALAYAKHPGMPAALIRAVATEFIQARAWRDRTPPDGPLTEPEAARQPLPDGPTAEQTAATLDRLTFYLRRTADPEGPTLYRLFHQQLVDQLAGRHYRTAVTVLDGLLNPLRTTPGAPLRWDLALPYHARHALEHAVDARRADELIADPGFLIHTGPPFVTMEYAGDGTARELAAVYRKSGVRHSAVDATGRRSLLAIDAVRSGRGGLLPLLADGRPPAGGWTPLWASGSAGEEAAATVLRGGPGPVKWLSVSQAEGSGRTEISSGTNVLSGVEARWDLASGQRLPAEERSFRLPWRMTTLMESVPMTEAELGLRTETGYLRPDGRRLRMWHPGPGETVRFQLDGSEPIPLVERAYRFAYGGHGTPVVAIASGSPLRPRLHLLDLDTDELLVATSSNWIRGPVRSMVVYAVRPGRTVVAARAPAGTVVWTVDTTGDLPYDELTTIPDPDGEHDDSGPPALLPDPLGEPMLAVARGPSVTLHSLRDTDGPVRVLGGGARSVSALTFARSGGRRLLAGGAADGAVRVWDLDTPPAPDSGVRHPGPVTALATGTVRGRRVVVCGVAGEVWIRELATGRTLRRLATGQVGLSALAVTRLGRRPVVVTAGASWEILLWDLEHGTPVGRPLTFDAGRVTALATGRLDGRTVVAAGSHETIAFWDAATGRLIGEHPSAHREMVAGLAFVPGTPRLVSTGWDGAVRFWQLTDDALTLLAVGTAPAPVTCATVTEGPGGPLVLTGDGTGEIRTWDALTGEASGAPTRGHRGALRQLVTGRHAGEPAVFSLGRDHTLRVHHRPTGRPLALIDLPDGANDLVWASPGLLAVAVDRDVVLLREGGPARDPQV
ncbi:hypothetical protein ABZ714_20865 [Streptomyces sp. NPDC006798]|uniref:hypothetical protein n=1 Tax=Streptomyces sp. NPDC006798 TaxID=3155462 RepID=UPI0033DC5A81